MGYTKDTRSGAFPPRPHYRFRFRLLDFLGAVFFLPLKCTTKSIVLTVLAHTAKAMLKMSLVSVFLTSLLLLYYTTNFVESQAKIQKNVKNYQKNIDFVKIYDTIRM